MRTHILTLAFILFTGVLFGQNENPYSQFGYEAPVMPENERPLLQNRMDRFYLINTDTASLLGMLAIDPSKRNITIFDKRGFLLQVDTLSDYTMARWLSADPYGQFSSPYVGMGNRPNMSTDPDGGWSWITAGIGFAVGAGAAALSGNGDDWWKWGLAGGLAGGASFNQTRLPFNSFSNYSITASSFGSSIGNAFSGAGRFIGNNSGIITGAARSYLSTYQSSSKWKTVGSASLPYVGQAPYAEWCVYACGQSVDSWLGGSRTASDFAKWQNGGVALDKGPGTEGAWFKFWQKNFPSNYVNAGSSGNPLV